MNKKEFVKALDNFVENNDFRINPDESLTSMLLEGLFANQKEHGLKLCPCRLRDGSRNRDIELICPCNFKSQDTWKTEDRCWCGLFIKR